MKRKFVFASLFLAASFQLAHAGSRMKHLSFYSADVHDTMKVVVLLPSNFDSSRSYPVLYLLHGYGGDQNDWTKKTDLVQYTAGLPLITVMPEAKNSWYVNSQTNPKARYEGYMMHDLPRFIEKHFQIDTARQAIAGLSMGGYGALMLALRHPGKFLFAGSLSGAITIPQIIDSVLSNPHFSMGKPQRGIFPNIVRTFGKDNKKFREEHNVFYLLSHDKPSSVPYLFIAQGIQDQFKEFLPADHRFIDSLRVRGVRYEYHELPGQHSWKFWNEEVRPMLRRMAKVMDLQENPKGN